MPTGTKNNFNKKFGLVSLVLVGLGLSLIHLFYHKSDSVKASPWDWRQGRMNGFHSQAHPDPYAAPQPGDYFPQVTLPLQFGVTLPDVTSQIIRLKFRYRCATACQAIWINVPVNHGQPPITVLVKHDLIEKLKYPSVTNSTGTLFQKHVSFATPEEFLAASPLQQQSIYTDSGLVRYYPQLIDSQPLETTYSPNLQPDFIYTTYKRPRIFADGWIEFARDFSLTNMIIDNSSTIKFNIIGEPVGASLDITKHTAEIR
jgi:hypothetical protein